jgi:hypothetical protein
MQKLGRILYGGLYKGGINKMRDKTYSLLCFSKREQQREQKRMKFMKECNQRMADKFIKQSDIDMGMKIPVIIHDELRRK